MIKEENHGGTFYLYGGQDSKLHAECGYHGTGCDVCGVVDIG